MKKLAIVFAVGAAALLGGSAANATDSTVNAKTSADATQSTDISSRNRYYGHRRYGYRNYGYRRPYYRSYGYAPRYYGGGYGGPYYGGGYGYGGPSISFGFGVGGFRGW